MSLCSTVHYAVTMDTAWIQLCYTFIELDIFIPIQLSDIP